MILMLLVVFFVKNLIIEFHEMNLKQMAGMNSKFSTVSLFEVHSMNSNCLRFFTKENYKQNENHDTGRIFKEEKLHRSMTNIVLVDSLEKKIIHIKLTRFIPKETKEQFL